MPHYIEPGTNDTFCGKFGEDDKLCEECHRGILDTVRPKFDLPPLTDEQYEKVKLRKGKMMVDFNRIGFVRAA